MLLTAIILLSAAVLLASWYAYRTAFYSPPSHRAQIEDPMEGDQYVNVTENIFRISHIMERIPFREVIITSHDGLSLYGRYYHVREGAPLEILFHGYRSHAFRDCSGGHALSRKMGFNALVVDQRAHGKSSGTTICFGIKERYDVLSWIQYVNENLCESSPIILSGLSMGAATVLMAAGEKLPENVIGVLADCGYTSAKEIMYHVMRQMKLPPKLCYPFVKLGAKLFGHFDPDENSPLEAVKRCSVPVIFFHGEADDFVPCTMSRENFEACAARKQLVTIPGAGHGLSYAVQPQRYLQELQAFFGPEGSYPQ